MVGRQTWLMIAVSISILAANMHAAELSEKSVRKQTGIEKRELWTTGNIHGSPEPPDRFTTQDAFPKLKFHEPLSVGAVPGQNRFGVATRPGKIYLFDNRPDVSESELILDLKHTTYGLVFHPKFATNRQIFVTYIVDPAKTDEN